MTFKFFTIVLLYTFVASNHAGYYRVVFDVNDGDKKVFYSQKPKSNLSIYCYTGNEKSLLRVFQTIMVELIIDNTDDYIIIYQANNYNLIEEQMKSDEVVFSLNTLKSYFLRQNNFTLDSFLPSCFSIKTNSNFKIIIHPNAFDSRRLAMFMVGLILFSYSAQLSHNSLFYYLCGITIGVTASLVFITLFISCLLPQKKLMFGYLGTSFMLSLYAVKIFMKNINIILMLNNTFILGYIIFSIWVSFIICYRYGPVTNPSSIDLIKWMLQFIGLALVTLSSFHLEAMIFVDIFCVIFYYTGFSLPFRLLPKKKPIKRLLTEEEYIQQAFIETPKALEELQKYCLSSDCDSWKLVKKLRDPKKFAQFVETAAHVTARTVNEYEKRIDECETEPCSTDISTDTDSLTV